MRAMKIGPMLLGPILLAGCMTLAPPPVLQPAPDGLIPPNGGQTPRGAAQTFVGVVGAVEPVAETMCRQLSSGQSCNLQIVVDDRPDQPPNAFQTVDRLGRPIVGFTLALIADAQNADEIAFVMGHEAAHHILGHIPKREQSALNSAILAGVLAQAGGATPETIRAAQDLGAEIGSRTYSKDFELEADGLGAEIALIAGFDPVRGAQFFSRLPDPGDQFLGSHPRNSERQAMVRETVARLTGS
ncbi:MAG: M48 family metallopeptidase [Pseudomonadota bacterium]